MKQRKQILSILFLFLFFLNACTRSSVVDTTSNDWESFSPIGSMELQYAEQFTVTYYPSDYALITIGQEQQYLLVPENQQVPNGMDSSVTIIQQPVDNLYLAASSCMDLFDGLNALDSVRMTSTKTEDWSLPAIQQALEEDKIIYVGKYSTPDYETILSENCGLAIESTMIYHSPETKEQLETLGIPVMVEQSSYESHPLGRLEWIKLYGLLLNKEREAEALFQEQSVQLDHIQMNAEADTNKTVAFFYLSTNGYVNVRKPGDYISKMIELAGGKYIFSAKDLRVEENALSTMNIQMETFYALAKDADYLIYNSTIDGELDTMEQLLQKNALLNDFKAVKNGNVWCTEKNMFQQTTGTANMIADLHAIVTGEADTERQLTFLHRLH